MKKLYIKMSKSEADLINWKSIHLLLESHRCTILSLLFPVKIKECDTLRMHTSVFLGSKITDNSKIANNPLLLSPLVLLNLWMPFAWLVDGCLKRMLCPGVFAAYLIWNDMS